MHLPWILIIVTVMLAILIAVIRFIAIQEKCVNIYKGFFIIGVIWLLGGIAITNYVFSVIGLLFLIIGLLNHKKWGKGEGWSELSPAERKTIIMLLVISGLLLIAGIVVFLLKRII